MEFLNDHVILDCTLGIDKPRIKKDVKLVRNWKKLDGEKFFAHLDLKNLSLEMDDLEEMLNNYEDVVNRNLDKQISYKMRKTPKVVNQIWYDDELREMKKKMCRRKEYGESTRYNING